MGLRVRLKALGRHLRLRQAGAGRRAGAQAYGMILADNGWPWYISGASDRRCNDDDLHGLGKLKGSDFEVVDTSSLRNGCPGSPERGTPGATRHAHDAAMGILALAPAAVAFPVVFCLTYFLCVGLAPRARLLTLAGVLPLAAIAIWLETGGAHGTCGPACLGLQGRRARRLVARALVAARRRRRHALRGLARRRRRRVTKSRAAAAQPGA